MLKLISNQISDDWNALKWSITSVLSYEIMACLAKTLKHQVTGHAGIVQWYLWGKYFGCLFAGFGNFGAINIQNHEMPFTDIPGIESNFFDLLSLPRVFFPSRLSWGGPCFGWLLQTPIQGNKVARSLLPLLHVARIQTTTQMVKDLFYYSNNIYKLVPNENELDLYTPSTCHKSIRSSACLCYQHGKWCIMEPPRSWKGNFLLARRWYVRLVHSRVHRFPKQ